MIKFCEKFIFVPHIEILLPNTLLILVLFGSCTISLQQKMMIDEKNCLYGRSEFKDGFLNDFRQFAEAGAIPKEREADVEKIKKMLEE